MIAIDAVFEDNYFELLPRVPKRVRVRLATERSPGRVAKMLAVRAVPI